MDYTKEELEKLKSNFKLEKLEPLDIKTAGKSIFFTAFKEGKKIFIKCNNYAQNEYEKTKLLYELNNENFIKPIGVLGRFILFEFIKGQTLSSYLKSADRSKDRFIISGLENIAKTLIQANIIHRDLHEGNIIITENNIKLIDFQTAVRLLKPEPSVLGSTCSYFDDMYSLNLIINKMGGGASL